MSSLCEKSCLFGFLSFGVSIVQIFEIKSHFTMFSWLFFIKYAKHVSSHILSQQKNMWAILRRFPNTWQIFCFTFLFWVSDKMKQWLPNVLHSIRGSLFNKPSHGINQCKIINFNYLFKTSNWNLVKDNIYFRMARGNISKLITLWLLRLFQINK